MDAYIREATRDAVRYMIDLLAAERGLSRQEAYMLCSVTGDLRMHEVVSTVASLGLTMSEYRY